MRKYDDSDMKIFGEKSAEETASAAEVQQLMQEMKRQRLNGNSDKAKKIGARIATLAPGGENEDSVQLDNALNNYLTAPYVMYQIRVLIIFAAESNLHRLLPSSFLATTAINALYDTIIENEPRFYDNISDGTAFTFYYLRLRSGGDIDRGIGEAFAMLCDKENDEKMISLGSEVYHYICKKMDEFIDEADFAEE